MASLNLAQDGEKYRKELVAAKKQVAALEKIVAAFDATKRNDEEPLGQMVFDQVQLTPSVLDIIGKADEYGGMRKSEIRAKLGEMGYDPKPVKFAIRLGKVLRRQLKRKTITTETKGAYLYYKKGSHFYI